MYSFTNDYSEGAHPSILEKLENTNLLQMQGYGEDVCCLQAANLIREQIACPGADVHFIIGGTQTNLISLSAFLRPHEAVISADTGHIEVHETGAIEATGHKIVTIASPDGKLTEELIKPVLLYHTDEHMVKPRLVYISNTTEIGTHYTKEELKSLSTFCRKNNLILYLDGARLGSALTVKGCNMTMADIAQLTDAFYIGGTKNGALMGEALVICNDELKSDFRFLIKQRGGMLAKGRVLGIQFLTLFEDELYFKLARYANDMAALLKDGISKAGYQFTSNSASNQLFPILPDRLIENLQKQFEFHVFPYDEKGMSEIRLVTSWATPKKAIIDFIDCLNEFS